VRCGVTGEGRGSQFSLLGSLNLCRVFCDVSQVISCPLGLSGDVWVDGDAGADCAEGWRQYFILMTRH